MEECHKLLTDQVDDAILRYNVNKPLPLGGAPGHVTIQSDFFFNKDLEYLRYDRKMGGPALLPNHFQSRLRKQFEYLESLAGSLALSIGLRSNFAKIGGVCWLSIGPLNIVSSYPGTSVRTRMNMSYLDLVGTVHDSTVLKASHGNQSCHLST
ncbi:hypothetical protein Tco_0749818 [Tanacetum coccineum]|uniref:Uncharacterized protein n=1 Tax=Tanacetum coccineum TaxID=301880 RepID=A0ABQ4Z2L6_9ASTR